MATFVSPAAYAASQTLAAQGLPVKRSHLAEVIAALLGYRAYAALTVEEADATKVLHLDDAEIIVLNQALGLKRAADLGLQGPPTVAACVAALKATASNGDAQVFDGLAEFYDLHARQELVETIAYDDAVAGVMAGSNAIYPDDPEINDECPPTADLWSTIDEWRIEVIGKMKGEYDQFSERAFNGDTLHCWSRLNYLKAGRAGLVFFERGADAEADDSWIDDQINEDEELTMDNTEENQNPVTELLARAITLGEAFSDYETRAQAIDDRVTNEDSRNYVPLDDLPYGEELVRIRHEDALPRIAALVEQLKDMNDDEPEALEEAEQELDSLQSLFDQFTPLPSLDD